MYKMLLRGEYFRINYKGEISRENESYSGNWLVVAVVPHHNMRPYTELQWPALKERLDNGEEIEGYLYDRDHGTLRFHGGRYLGKLPKATIWKTR